MRSNFYHRTNNLHPILDTGRVETLKHIARRDPDSEIEVEPDAGGKNLGGLASSRTIMRAEDALEHMKGTKVVDKVFLSRDTLPNESYGRYVIEKNLKSPLFHTALNLIPNEYTSGRALSVKHNANIYVPNDEYAALSKSNPKYNIRSIDDLEVRDTTLKDRLSTLARKLTKSASDETINSLYNGSERDIRKILSPNATIVGSEGIGIDIGSKSDRDILVPYKTRKGYNRLVNKLKSEGFGLEESKWNDRKRDGYKVYSYKDANYDVDVALVHGGKAGQLANHVRRLRDTLTDEQKAAIKKEKERLSNAWFFRDYRYTKYKRGVDKELGLTQFHE